MKRPTACEYAERTFFKWQYLAAINVTPLFELIKQPYTTRKGHERKADTITKACTSRNTITQRPLRVNTRTKKEEENALNKAPAATFRTDTGTFTQ
jgi:hypothetical protein